MAFGHVQTGSDLDMKNLTVIYYSSNREKPEFEEMVKNKILNVIGDTQVISVTQKPMDFGRNVCVGDVGLSDYNIYRQMEIACKLAKTKYVCTAEADCFYPPTGYFDFKPPEDWTAGHYTNMYILWKGSHIFKQKAFSLCALYANREFLLSRFPRSLDSAEWRPDFKPKHPLFHKYHDWTPFHGVIPVINTKTGDGMRIKTGVGTEGPPQTELPYWGKATEMEHQLWKI
jgi:hypothetical protein